MDEDKTPEDRLTVTMPKSVTNLTRAGENLAKKAPELIAMVAIVGGFLWYLERHDQRELTDDMRIDTLAELRIDTCHDVQERGIAVMEDLSSAMSIQTETMDDLDRAIMDLRDMIHEHLVAARARSAAASTDEEHWDDPVENEGS